MIDSLTQCLEALRAFVVEKGISEAAGHISHEAFAGTLDTTLVDRKKVADWVRLHLVTS